MGQPLEATQYAVKITDAHGNFTLANVTESLTALDQTFEALKFAYIDQKVTKVYREFNNEEWEAIL